MVLRTVALGNFIVPKRRQLVMHAFPDVEDQLVAVLRWLRDHPEAGHRVIFLVSGDEGEARRRLRLLVGEYVAQIQVLKKTRPKAIWAYWRSRYVFFTHGLYGFFPVPKRQCVVNLWHGMPIKLIWKGLTDNAIPQCRWLLSTSPKYSEVLATASGLNIAKIPVTGLPRNDLLFSDTSAARAFSDKVRAGVERVLLFLPTYRQSAVGFMTQDGQETASALAMTEAEIDQLKLWLARTRTRMLVKPHPMSVHYGQNLELDERLWIISDSWLQDQGLTLYEALGQMDALITDVSSVYVDFLALRRPVFFYFPDLERYRQTRKFLLEPVEDWLAGPLCTTAPELFASLQAWVVGDDSYTGLRDQLAKQLNPQIAQTATWQLINSLPV